MSRLDDFRIARRWRLGNRSAQLVLALTLTLGLTFLASQPMFSYRRDLTLGRVHSLTDETLANLRALVAKSGAGAQAPRPPIEILVTLPRDLKGDTETAAADRQRLRLMHSKLDGLLAAFAHEGARLGVGALTVADADLARNAKLNTDLADKLRGEFDPKFTVLVVRCGERIKAVQPNAVFRLRKGAGGREELEFTGESAVLSAILEVSDFRRPVVYYTNNHGELDPEAENPMRACARWHAELRERRFDLRPLNLDRVTEVPADADLLLLGGPGDSFSRRETDKLRRYLSERNGRVLALLRPTSRHGLDELLLDWGLLAQDAILCEDNPAVKSPDGDIVVGHLAEHATTRVLFDMGLPLYAGFLRPIQEDPGRPSDTDATPASLDSTLRVDALFGSSDRAWGERDYRRPPYSPSVDKGDLVPPVGHGLNLGMAAERAVRVKGRARITGGRLVVIGTADIAADTRYEKGGNRHFLLSASNWLLDRDYLVSVPARPLTEFKLNASSDDLAGLAKRYALIPLGVALFGFLMYWWRRRT